MARLNYIDINGLVVQDLDDIVKELSSKFKEIYGLDINLDQNTPDGQWINILAQEKKDVLDLLVQIYNNMDVDSVIGFPQQLLYKLNGLKIKAYSYSYLYVDVTVSKSVTLKGLDENIESEDGVGFTVSDNAGNDWILTETTNLSQGTHSLRFRAKELGSVQASINTVNIMTTVLPGVVSVNNSDNNYMTGNTGETPAEFRRRRHRVMAVPSQGFKESIESQLLNLVNVTQAKVYDNKNNTIVSDIPPHAIWVIVQGGDKDEIGNIIYNNVPPGIPMKGEVQVEVVRPNGEVAVVNYDLPTSTNMYIKAKINRTGTSIIDELYLKEQLSLLHFDIGEACESSYITAKLKELLVDNGNPYDVELSLDGSVYSNRVTPSGLDEYFVIPKENIIISR